MLSSLLRKAAEEKAPLTIGEHIHNAKVGVQFDPTDMPAEFICSAAEFSIAHSLCAIAEMMAKDRSDSDIQATVNLVQPLTFGDESAPEA